MEKISTTEAGKRIGEAVDRARKGPIVLTRYGRPVAVLIDSSDFAELLIHLDHSSLPAWKGSLKALQKQK